MRTKIYLSVILGIAALIAIRVVAHQSAPAPIPVICQQYYTYNLQTGQLVPDPTLPEWMKQQAISQGCQP